MKNVEFPPFLDVIGTVSLYHLCVFLSQAIQYDSFNLKTNWVLYCRRIYLSIYLSVVLARVPLEFDHDHPRPFYSLLFHARCYYLMSVYGCLPSRAGETHLHMQQYIRATQLPITTKFTLSPFSKEEVRSK